MAYSHCKLRKVNRTVGGQRWIFGATPIVRLWGRINRPEDLRSRTQRPTCELGGCKGGKRHPDSGGKIVDVEEEPGAIRPIFCIHQGWEILQQRRLWENQSCKPNHNRLVRPDIVRSPMAQARNLEL
ncbi:Hypothetical protein NTJ_00791 [Nesidiocoris tenuis]|uniref:Uncharacterized protein n=1 Tax=Nesidiocoris tenuis TaxID=355587 RepID=A0ABN7A6V9_9HEMI|nr:Hypothetical protein NTJ_00791 [Nesidiocoris tenuis]